MANIEGQQTSYKNLGPMLRSVVDVMNIYGHKTPLLNALFGGNEDKPALSKKPTFLNGAVSTKAEWYNKKLRPSVVTLGANYTSGGTSLTITPANDALYINKGQILLIDNERFIATANGVAGGTVAVAGAKFGTSAANHTSAAKIRFIGRAQGETSDTSTDNYQRGDSNYNYFQGLRVTFSSTWKNQQVNYYDAASGKGRASRDNWKVQEEKDATLEAFKQLEESFIYGLRNEGDGTDANPATFGGLYQFAIGDDYSGATLSATKLTTSVKDMWALGGDMTVPDLLICSGTTRTKLNAIYGANYTQQIAPGDTVTAGQVTDKIRFEFTTVDVLPINNLSDSDIFLLRKEHCWLYPLGELAFATYPVAQAGVRDLFQVYGEYSGGVDLPESARRIYNFVLP